MGVKPFSEQERVEIESLSEEVFSGRYRPDSELAIEYGRWMPYIVHLYAPVCDSETGDFRHLPFPGSLVDQPHITLEILRVIQMAYRKVVSESLAKG